MAYPTGKPKKLPAGAAPTAGASKAGKKENKNTPTQAKAPASLSATASEYRHPQAAALATAVEGLTQPAESSADSSRAAEPAREPSPSTDSQQKDY